MDEDNKNDKGVRLVFEGVTPIARAHLKYLTNFHAALDGTTEGEWLSELIMNEILPKHWGEKKIASLTEELTSKIEENSQHLKL